MKSTSLFCAMVDLQKDNDTVPRLRSLSVLCFQSCRMKRDEAEVGRFYGPIRTFCLMPIPQSNDAGRLTRPPIHFRTQAQPNSTLEAVG